MLQNEKAPFEWSQRAPGWFNQSHFAFMMASMSALLNWLLN
jgi:hypothetical protein